MHDHNGPVHLHLRAGQRLHRRSSYMGTNQPVSHVAVKLLTFRKMYLPGHTALGRLQFLP